ncbi:hypothetical protein Tco_0975876 [Tanacetum coccineum]|uniref:Uncharacterized protein n=1 Tax=Tanacetum coccineum TaxID=301880 RepID=A0ABQ5EFM3_9ASTR
MFQLLMAVTPLVPPGNSLSSASSLVYGSRKELFTWNPSSLKSYKEEHEYSSKTISVQGVGSKENKYNTYEKEEGEFNNSEDEEVAETDFMEKSSQSMEHSVHVDKEISADPFGLNDLLGSKKPVEENLEPESVLSQHTPGSSRQWDLEFKLARN